MRRSCGLCVQIRSRPEVAGTGRLTVISGRLPWEDGRSILAVVGGNGSGDAEPVLPDEPADDPTQVRWSAGAVEGVGARHFEAGPGASAAAAPQPGSVDDERDVPAQVVARLRRLVRDPGDEERLALYRVGQSERVLADVNAVLERFGADRDLVVAAGPHARWLVREARHRGPLKLGIALLGVCGEPQDAEVLKVLGRHDEFTLYCAVALVKLLPDPVDALWEVARSACGWGRIEAVERLAPLVGDRPEIGRWLLTQGYKNSIMYQYLAFTCATHGGLADALAGAVDDELLDGACDLVDSLCRGGPVESMYHYPDGPLACERLLERLEERGTTLGRLPTVIELLRWLKNEGLGPEAPHTPEHARLTREMRAHLEGQGWSGELFAKLRARCRAILTEPHWPELVRAVWASGGHRERWRAWYVAPHVDVDLWESGFERLRSGPLDHLLVDRLVRKAPLKRQQRVVAWAEEHLVLERVASDPELCLFPTPEQADERALGWVVQAMRTPELYSESLVAAALLSPVVQTRVSALNALKAQPRESWGSTVEQALERLRHEEPSPQVREKLLALIG